MHPIIHEIKESLKGVYSESEAGALAKLLLVEVFGFSTLELYGGKDKAISEKERSLLNDIIKRLLQNEPIQYILGVETFCGLNFRVDKNVLIPRPETQELVEWILSDNKNLKDGRILDIGTGSGCIAITLAKNLPEVEVEAWDVSKGALQIATQNASDNEVRVHFVEQDVLAFIPQGTYFDVMVSNPPYITEVEKNEMEANVLEWEPETALFVQDNDALLFYREIAALGCVMLKPGGMLYFEINRAYGAEMVEMLNGMGYSFVELRKDLFGNDRMVKATK
ncbi:MAG: peptide chain release factor N(5)-glutamine methyltransferase [Bacteroides sp.]|nr:peptide chain release factor N(5)-glutamine methyltransferase [Bacteroides sp.]